jgi:hypothetical protein
MATNTLYKRNIYSDELLKTIYVDTELNYIKEADKSNPDGNGKENYDQVTKTAPFFVCDVSVVKHGT